MKQSPYHFHIYTRGESHLPAILFLHGFMGCAEDWREIFDWLSDRLYCVAVDLPGHGKTTVTGNDEFFRMEHVATGVANLLHSMEISTCHLVGYSMGGRLAIYLAVHFPSLFQRVILESTSPGLRMEPERTVRRRHDHALAERLMQIPYNQFLDEWYQQPLFKTMHQYRDRLLQLQQARLQNDVANLARSLNMMGTGSQPSLWEHLQGITAPTLLIVGEEDTKFKAIAVEMQTGFQKAETVVVPNSGHAVHWEQPELFAELVYDFLNIKR